MADLVIEDFTKTTAIADGRPPWNFTRNASVAGQIRFVGAGANGVTTVGPGLNRCTQHIAVKAAGAYDIVSWTGGTEGDDTGALQSRAMAAGLWLEAHYYLDYRPAKQWFGFYDVTTGWKMYWRFNGQAADARYFDFVVPGQGTVMVYNILGLYQYPLDAAYYERLDLGIYVRRSVTVSGSKYWEIEAWIRLVSTKGASPSGPDWLCVWKGLVPDAQFPNQLAMYSRYVQVNEDVQLNDLYIRTGYLRFSDQGTFDPATKSAWRNVISTASITGTADGVYEADLAGHTTVTATASVFTPYMVGRNLVVAATGTYIIDSVLSPTKCLIDGDHAFAGKAVSATGQGMVTSALAWVPSKKRLLSCIYDASQEGGSDGTIRVFKSDYDATANPVFAVWDEILPDGLPMCMPEGGNYYNGVAVLSSSDTIILLFTKGTDNVDRDIYARVSSDGGDTWGAEYKIVDAAGTWLHVLRRGVRTPGGKWLFAYHVHASGPISVARSTAAVPGVGDWTTIATGPATGYNEPNLVILPNGKLCMPCRYSAGAARAYMAYQTCDDPEGSLADWNALVVCNGQGGAPWIWNGSAPFHFLDPLLGGKVFIFGPDEGYQPRPAVTVKVSEDNLATVNLDGRSPVLWNNGANFQYPWAVQVGASLFLATATGYGAHILWQSKFFADDVAGPAVDSLALMGIGR
jgi:hypothetical protein